MNGREQSAYRRGHSTETAFLGIHNDLITAADRPGHKGFMLGAASIDLDTVDHNILLTRLSDNVGLFGVLHN